jgi:hypothetical protein
MATTRYHIVVDLRGVLRLTNRELKRTGLISDEGKPLTPDEIRSEAIELLRKGFDVAPAVGCDNYDDTGHCKGHPAS